MESLPSNQTSPTTNKEILYTENLLQML